jgi:hypothetical protein
MAREIKHWGKRYSAFTESICSSPGCMNEGTDYREGRVWCIRCLNHSLRLEVPRKRYEMAPR